MSKKAKNKGVSVEHKETLQRLNFLYQASILVTTLTSRKELPSSQSDRPHNENKRKAEDSTASPSKRTGHFSDDVDSSNSRPVQEDLDTREGCNYQSSDLEGLGRLYGYHLKSVAKKLVLRLDPSIKRTICKSCDAFLLPGKTAHVEYEGDYTSQADQTTSSKPNKVVWKCTFCQRLKRFS